MSDFKVVYGAGGELDKIKEIERVGGIQGLATKSLPYNTMRMYDIPAGAGEHEFEIQLPSTEVEIAGMTLTCSGYGETDCYDIYANGRLWFDNWYTAEVKESLFAGTTTSVYSLPADSVIKLVFKNQSGTRKTVWFGIRMLV